MKAHSASLLLSAKASRTRRLASLLLHGGLVLVTSASMFAVIFIFYYIIRDAFPFFRTHGFREFFTSPKWYPSANPGSYGALAIFYGSGIVTLGAILFSVPIGIAAAITLSDILSFRLRQILKPVIEMLAMVPSVAYGFFALVVLAPLLQQSGGKALSIAAWMIGVPFLTLCALLISELAASRLAYRRTARIVGFVILETCALGLIWLAAGKLSVLQIPSGRNALNVSIILGIMALPTVVSVSEDALQAVGRELREGSYALGATRAETLVKVVLPAASGGVTAAVMLGAMRAIGETMVVWMASGNATQIPKPWYNILEPVRTLTATIAGDMGEADQVTGSARYHVLFAMALCLLTISFVGNLVSELIISRTRRKLRGA
jgi:phosphate transport system permease protein